MERTVLESMFPGITARHEITEEDMARIHYIVSHRDTSPAWAFDGGDVARVIWSAGLLDERTKKWVTEEALSRGLLLFRELASIANRGEAERRSVIGVAYGDFLSIVKDYTSFDELCGKPFNQSYIPTVIDVAYAVTEANRVYPQAVVDNTNGRIPVRRNGTTIASAMDTYIWNVSKRDRSPNAFKDARVPYTQDQWRTVFPSAFREIVRPGR